MAREVPEWAQAVIRDECRRAKVRQPVVVWRHGSGGGHYNPPGYWYGAYYPKGRIVCSPVNDSEANGKPILLHELAHHISYRQKRPRRTHRWHGKHFIRVLRRLYTRHGILVDGKLHTYEYATVGRALLRGAKPAPELTVEQMLANIAAFIQEVEEWDRARV